MAQLEADLDMFSYQRFFFELVQGKSQPVATGVWQLKHQNHVVMLCVSLFALGEVHPFQL